MFVPFTIKKINQVFNTDIPYKYLLGTVQYLSPK